MAGIAAGLADVNRLMRNVRPPGMIASSILGRIRLSMICPRISTSSQHSAAAGNGCEAILDLGFEILKFWDLNFWDLRFRITFTNPTTYSRCARLLATNFTQTGKNCLPHGPVRP